MLQVLRRSSLLCSVIDFTNRSAFSKVKHVEIGWSDVAKKVNVTLWSFASRDGTQVLNPRRGPCA